MNALAAISPWFVAEPRPKAYIVPTKHLAPAKGLTPAKRVVLEPTPLRDTIRELRLALSVLTVAVAALRKQNADNDADVAEVLERYASDRLDMQIEKLRALLDAD